MAKKAVAPRKSKTTHRSPTSTRAHKVSAKSGTRNFFMDIYENPTFRYVAGGMATAILTNLAKNIGDKYPEISKFMKENLSTMEERLTEYNNSSRDYYSDNESVYE